MTGKGHLHMELSSDSGSSSDTSATLGTSDVSSDSSSSSGSVLSDRDDLVYTVDQAAEVVSGSRKEQRARDQQDQEHRVTQWELDMHSREQLEHQAKEEKRQFKRHEYRRKEELRRHVARQAEDDEAEQIAQQRDQARARTALKHRREGWDRKPSADPRTEAVIQNHLEGQVAQEEWYQKHIKMIEEETMAATKENLRLDEANRRAEAIWREDRKAQDRKARLMAEQQARLTPSERWRLINPTLGGGLPVIQGGEQSGTGSSDSDEHVHQRGEVARNRTGWNTTAYKKAYRRDIAAWDLRRRLLESASRHTDRASESHVGRHWSAHMHRVEDGGELDYLCSDRGEDSDPDGLVYSGVSTDYGSDSSFEHPEDWFKRRPQREQLEGSHYDRDQLTKLRTHASAPVVEVDLEDAKMYFLHAIFGSLRNLSDEAARILGSRRALAGLNESLQRINDLLLKPNCSLTLYNELIDPPIDQALQDVDVHIFAIRALELISERLVGSTRRMNMDEELDHADQGWHALILEMQSIVPQARTDDELAQDYRDEHQNANDGASIGHGYPQVHRRARLVRKVLERLLQITRTFRFGAYGEGLGGKTVGPEDYLRLTHDYAQAQHHNLPTLPILNHSRDPTS